MRDIKYSGNDHKEKKSRLEIMNINIYLNIIFYKWYYFNDYKKKK